MRAVECRVTCEGSAARHRAEMQKMTKLLQVVVVALIAWLAITVVTAAKYDVPGTKRYDEARLKSKALVQLVDDFKATFSADDYKLEKMMREVDSTLHEMRTSR